MLSPITRRLVDLRSEFIDPSPILLAPVLVTGITALFAVKVLNQHWRGKAKVFSLALLSILIGTVIGLLNHSPLDVGQAFLNWATPICFGIYICFAPAVKTRTFKVVQLNLQIALILLGVYGTIQFFVGPAWDIAWLEHLKNKDFGDSFGQPRPYGIRVWGTLNSPGAFSSVMMCGLVLLMSDLTKVAKLACAVAIPSFVLSLVRASWLGLIAGAIRSSLQSGRQLTRLAQVATLSCLLIAPLAFVPDAQEVIADRFQSFTQLSSDASLIERQQLHMDFFQFLPTHPFGVGLNSSFFFKDAPVDGALLHILLMFGWIGGSFLLYSLGSLLIESLRQRKNTVVIVGSQAVIVAIFSQSFSGEIASGVTGFLLWIFAGLLLGESQSVKS